MLLEGEGGGEGSGVESQLMAELIKTAVTAFATEAKGHIACMAVVSGLQIHVERSKELEVVNLIGRLSNGDQLPEARISKEDVTHHVIDGAGKVVLNELEKGTSGSVLEIKEADGTRDAVAEM